MFTSLIIFSLFLLFSTVAPHFPGKHWLIRVWEFPRVQLIVLIATTIAVWLYFLPLHGAVAVGFICLLLLALAHQIRWVIPYTLLWPKEVKRIRSPHPAQRITIMTSNVYMYNDNYQGLISLVDENTPDMLITLESNQKWQDAMAAIHADYPHRLACPLENLYGMHLYSKLPFIDSKVRFIVEDDVPSMEVQLELDGKKITVYFLHPKPPSPTENETAEPRDIELSIVGNEMEERQEPVIVAGDLNDVAWSPTTRKFRKLNRARDPRIGRGFFNTFHAKHSLIRWPLDHVFHSEDFDLVSVKRLEGYGSDHFPLYICLSLRRDNT